MAAFPNPPYEFNLEHANAAGVDLFAAIITSCSNADEWARLNRELPVRLFLREDAPALHWWAYVGDRRGTSTRSEQVTNLIPDWLWELLTTETTADSIRDAGRSHGVYYPTKAASA